MPKTVALPYRDPSLPTDKRVADLLSRMTLDEKIAQMSIFHMRTNNLPDETVILDQAIQKQLANGVGAMGRPGFESTARATASWINAIQKHLRENTRLGIPVLFMDEALHGLMAFGSTSFPQAIGLASTWNPDLVQQVFTAVAREMRGRGENHALSPVLDLGREPRWGRTEETYGEDPYLGSRMAVAAVCGLQGEPHARRNSARRASSIIRQAPIDKQHVLATAKHFAVHGQPESGRNCGPTNYAEREIRENFLAAFQAAVMEAGVGCVMASYNEVNGIPMHANSWLLQDILREEWGFQGFVISDGYGISLLETLHHVAASKAEAARKALEAGIDFELDDCYHTLPAQVKEGIIPEALVNTAVSRILQAKFLLRLFDDPYVDPEEAERVTNCAAHQQLALEAAHQSLVLLKNTGNMLPLDVRQLKTLAVIGPNATGIHLGGYSADPGRGVSILDGIRNKVGDQVRVLYAKGCQVTANAHDPQGWLGWWEDRVLPPNPTEDEHLISEAVAIAGQADVAVLVIGENESICREAWSEDHRGDRDSLDLLGRQNDLVRAVAETGVPVVVLLINGRPLSINDIAEHVPAVFEGWYLGQAGGTAFADVLFGDVNPGGKLPITFPRSVGQLPAYYNHKPSAERSYLFASQKPLFPFGHGLSYTTFEYKNLSVSPAKIKPAGKATVSVQVTNTGRYAGDEVVQLYIRDQASSVTRPVKELKGFRRMKLQAGETQSVEFVIGRDQLAFFDEHMKRTVEPGLFDVMVGTNSLEVQTIQLEVVK